MYSFQRLFVVAFLTAADRTGGGRLMMSPYPSLSHRPKKLKVRSHACCDQTGSYWWLPSRRPGGFRSARDIAAITVNRWPHGYAYSADSLFDPQTPGPQPYEIARRRCGSVTIANSDAGWNSYTHEAIDQAWRAVKELKSA
jgi:hypothetical protein